MSNYPARYAAMLKDLKINNKDVADITGNTHGSTRAVVRPNTNGFPRWAKLAVWVHENKKISLDEVNAIIDQYDRVKAATKMDFSGGKIIVKDNTKTKNND